MSTRGSQFTRTMRYFRESDLDEATAAIARAIVIVNERTPAAALAPKVRKARKPKHAATEVAAGAAAATSGGQ